MYNDDIRCESESNRTLPYPTLPYPTLQCRPAGDRAERQIRGDSGHPRLPGAQIRKKSRKKNFPVAHLPGALERFRFCLWWFSCLVGRPEWCSALMCRGVVAPFSLSLSLSLSRSLALALALSLSRSPSHPLARSLTRCTPGPVPRSRPLALFIFLWPHPCWRPSFPPSSTDPLESPVAVSPILRCTFCGVSFPARPRSLVSLLGPRSARQRGTRPSTL